MVSRKRQTVHEHPVRFEAYYFASAAVGIEAAVKLTVRWQTAKRVPLILLIRLCKEIENDSSIKYKKYKIAFVAKHSLLYILYSTIFFLILRSQIINQL